jgi:hypothetical protein
VPRPDFDLYLVTDRKQTGGRELVEVVEQALAGGIQAVQLREKDLDGAELFRLAEALKRFVRASPRSASHQRPDRYRARGRRRRRAAGRRVDADRRRARAARRG